jgi:hypothetical protein
MQVHSVHDAVAPFTFLDLLHLPIHCLHVHNYFCVQACLATAVCHRCADVLPDELVHSEFVEDEFRPEANILVPQHKVEEVLDSYGLELCVLGEVMLVIVVEEAFLLRLHRREVCFRIQLPQIVLKTFQLLNFNAEDLIDFFRFT